MQIRALNNFSQNVTCKNQSSSRNLPLAFKSQLIIHKDVIDHEIRLAQDCTEQALCFKKDSYERLNFIPEERGEKTGTFFYQSYTFPKYVKSHLNSLKKKWEGDTKHIEGKTEIVLNNDRILCELEEDPDCKFIDAEDCDLLVIHTDNQGKKLVTGFDGKSLIGTFSGDDELKDVTSDSILDEAVSYLLNDYYVAVSAISKEKKKNF